MNSYKEKAISEKYKFLKFIQKQKSYVINYSCAKCGCPVSIKTLKKKYYMDFTIYNFDEHKLYCPECTNRIVFQSNKIGIILLSCDNVKIDYVPNHSIHSFIYASFFENDFFKKVESIEPKIQKEFLNVYDKFCKINTFCTGV